MTPSLPALWMNTVCSRSVPAVLSLYDAHAVLIPTYDKSDLPGAGHGVLIGQQKIAGYFHRFLAKPALCGTIDTMFRQLLGPVEVFSGLYTFHWNGGSARARYTFVVVGNTIVNHHSSEVPT
jgi:hypothetical protein